MFEIDTEGKQSTCNGDLEFKYGSGGEDLWKRKCFPHSSVFLHGKFSTEREKPGGLQSTESIEVGLTEQLIHRKS